MSNRPKARTTKQQARTAPAPGPVAQAGSGNSSPLLWIGLVALIVIAVVVGLVVSGGGDDDEPGEDARTASVEGFGFAEIIGEPLSLFTGQDPDPDIGTPAPTIRAQSMWSGEVLDLDFDDGTVRVIGFFAHWCPHCQAEVPRVTAWLTENETPEGVEIVAISTGIDEGSPNYPPSEWFIREGWPVEVLTDGPGELVSKGFGLTGFPYWVVVDANGNILERIGGELTEEQFSGVMQRAGAAAA